MNFNLDDPLAGILSDGSDDSFFDDDILGKKKPAKKNSTPTADKKKALFDLEDDDKEKPKDTDNFLSNKDSLKISTSKTESTDNDKILSKTDGPKQSSPAPVRSTAAKESTKVPQFDSKAKSVEKIDFSRSPVRSKITASADKLDLLDELSMEPKKEMVKSLAKGKSSQSLLDDILGGSSTKLNTSGQKRPATATKKQDFDFDSILGKSEPKQSASSHKNIAQKPVAKIDSQKEIQNKKKLSDDWLGVFQEKDEIGEEADEDMPSWLVGGSNTKKKSTDLKTETKAEVKKAPTPETINVDDKDQELKGEPDLDTVSQVPRLGKVDNIPFSSKLEVSNEDVTMEGAALYLQQQESQIMVALQLKAQDEKLAAMQMRQQDSQRVQREAAQAQREQLEALLKRQATQRHQMQAIIAAHQERITQRIKSLLGTSNENQQDDINPNENFESPSEQRDSPYTKEKKQLLQLVQSLQENHDKEIDLMETSYRRQLAFLEISFNQAEERMKEESDKLVKFYTEKISWLDEHHQLYKKLTDENLNSLMERHKTEYEMLQQLHLENARVLQEHHAALMENVKNAVKQEQALIKDSAGFSSELQELINEVKDNKSKCQELVQRIETLTQNTQQHTERSVQMREKQISDMIEQLKKERENFEKEKTESKDMVHMLEARLKQMTNMIEEESAALKQKKMEFEFEKATFSKQTEFAKNVLKKQDEEVKMLKEDIQREYQEKIAKIEEEKAKAFKDSAIVAKEKASVQTLKLDLEKTRAELQAQLEEVTAERSKLNVERQELHMEEQRVLNKSRDLDVLAKTAIEKQAQAEKKHTEAEFAQRKYEEQIRRLQEHVVSLNTREKQIAKEKVALSRERLTMHNERKQLENRQQCSLCRNTQYSDLTYIQDTYNPTVSRDYSAIPLNVVEQDVAHLMGRAFKLRHTNRPEVSAGYEDRHVDGNELDNASQTPAESGAFKDYLDPKFMMLRLDVQQVISNLDQSKKDDVDRNEDQA